MTRTSKSTSKIKAKRNLILAGFLIVGLVMTLSGTTGTAGKLTTFMNLPSSMSLFPSGAVFGDDFETGNFNAWDYESFYPVIESSVAYSGTYALEGNDGLLYKDLGNGYGDLFVSFYVYFTDVPVDSYIFPCQIWANTFSNGVNVAINTYGGSSWIVNIEGVSSGYYSAPIQTGHWYWVQLERNSNLGVANLWIDGNQVASASGSILGDGQIFVIGSGNNMDPNCYHYYDNAVASPSYIEFIPASTPIPTATPIGSTPTPTPSPTPYVTPAPTSTSVQPTPLPTNPPIIEEDNTPPDLTPINGDQPYVNTNEAATVGGLSMCVVVGLGFALNNGVFGKKR